MNHVTFLHRTAQAVLALAAALAAPALHAQQVAAATLADLSLDSLLDMPVNGASRFVQRRSQASSSVTVITREEIAAFGWRTLSDALRGVRGTIVSSDRIYDYLGVRGFFAAGDYNTRVLLLVDGNRINDAVYDQAFLGSEFPLDLQVVERIEFVPGQGSAVYGANALFGIVNVITREAPRQSQAALNVALGRQGERAVRGSWRQAWGDGGLQVQASRTLARGEDLFDPAQAGAGGDGWTRGTDGTRRSAAYLRLDLGGFTTSLMHVDRLKGTPMVVDLIYGDPRSRYRDTMTLLNVERAITLGESSRLNARLFAGRYDFIGDFAIDYPPVTLNRDESKAAWRGVELRLDHAFAGGHKVVAGMELQDTPTLVQRNYDVDPASDPYLDDRRRGWRAALFAEDQWSLSPDLDLNLGLRMDRSRGQGWQASPRAALVWAPAPDWSLKLIEGRAFRPPNAFEAHYAVDAPAGYRTNPGLRAETVRGTELAAEWRPRAAWRVAGSLYRNRARDLLLLNYDAGADRYQYDNAGWLDTHGAELELEYAQDGLRWRGSASAATVRGDVDAPYPARMLKSALVVPVMRDWTAALEWQAVSRRAAAPGYGVVNLAFHGPVAAGATLSVALRNVADKRAFDPGSDAQRQPVVPQPRRGAHVELSWPLSN